MIGLMAELKTQPTDRSVQEFIASIPDERMKRDCRALLKLFKEVTGSRPRLWGPSIVGYGTYHYRYASGREGDWMRTGFSPRKGALSIYLMSGFDGMEDDLKELGKHRLGKCCLYVKRLEEVDLRVLKRLVKKSLKRLDRVALA